MKYLQQFQFDIPGLPEGGTKHLLHVKDEGIYKELAEILCEYADVCPTQLPKSRPHRGLDDVHEIHLQPGTKAIAIPPYRVGPIYQALIDKEVVDLLEPGCI